jgi:tetratricopeptide (TPR) repeat protein
MLSEKLEQARSDAARKQRTTLLVVLGVFVFVGLIATTMTLYRELVDKREGPATVVDRIPAQTEQSLVLQKEWRIPEPIPTPLQPPKEPAKVAPVSKTPFSATRPDLPADVKAGTKPVAQQPLAKSTSPAPQLPSVPDQGSDLQQVETFKAAFKRFEDELAPKVDAGSFRKWRPKTQNDIQFLKNRALTEFGEGNAVGALDFISKASDLATKSVRDKKDEFELAMTNARAAFAADDYEAAKPYIQHALLLEPGSGDANALASEIEKLPIIVKHLEEAKVARAENRIEAEYEALKKVIEFAPTRVKWRERMHELAGRITEKTFSKHIQDGLAQVEKRHLPGATRNLEAARRLFAKRDETIFLETKVAKLDRDLKVEALLAAAKRSMANDDWVQSLDSFQKAKTIQADNQFAIDGHALSLSVLSVTRDLQAHLNSPQRLSSLNVAEDVMALVKKANTISGVSKSLDAAKSELVKVLATYAEEVPVAVVSDGQTFVSVRRVGRVGKVKEKVIKLRPGRYVFEGARAGYKSKLVNVDIPPGTSKVTVEISCDEQI